MTSVTNKTELLVVCSHNITLTRIHQTTPTTDITTSVTTRNTNTQAQH